MDKSNYFFSPLRFDLLSTANLHVLPAVMLRHIVNIFNESIFILCMFISEISLLLHIDIIDPRKNC